MQNLTRSEVEDFLYHEAALLDDWQLDDWLALYTADARYEVPATDLPRDAKKAASESPTAPGPSPPAACSPCPS